MVHEMAHQFFLPFQSVRKAVLARNDLPQRLKKSMLGRSEGSMMVRVMDRGGVSAQHAAYEAIMHLLVERDSGLT